MKTKKAVSRKPAQKKTTHHKSAYPCGCTASGNGPDPLPDYCPEHGTAPRKPVVDVVALEPDTVAIHVRTEPAHVAELLPHAEDPKTFFQKLADFFNPDK
jgi:hypothetical protein